MKKEASTSPAAPEAQAAEFIEKLIACGWFDQLPPAARERYRARVAEELRAGRPAWAGLADVRVPDLTADEDWYGEEPDDVVRRYAEASWGKFTPRDIKYIAADEDDEDVVGDVSFTLGERMYTDRYGRACGDTADVVGLINQALADAGSAFEFIAIDCNDEGLDAPVVFATDEAFERAAAQGLVPDAA